MLIDEYIAEAKDYIETDLPEELLKFKSAIAPVLIYSNVDIEKNVPFYIYGYREIEGPIGMFSYNATIDFLCKENPMPFYETIKAGMRYYGFYLITGYYAEPINGFFRLHFDFKTQIHIKGD
jgi:hypothetical protein